MDWMKLTPIQLMALGAQYAFCECNPTKCDTCRLRKKGVADENSYSIGECVDWVVKNPEEALELYGVNWIEGKASQLVLAGENIQLRKENIDLTTALAEVLSAKEALEVDLGDLKAVNDQLREENAALLKERDEADVGFEKAQKAEEELRVDMSAMTRAYCEEKGRADGLLEALKIIHGSQT